jgi:hypothetical protein
MALKQTPTAECMLDQAYMLADDFERKYVEPAFNGDVEAAFSLAVSLDHPERGLVAYLMWRARVEQAAFRSFFGTVWEHSHRYVVVSIETRRRLAAMFRYAAFPVPESLDDVVTVWRGVHGISIAKAATGYSWTLDRRVACWFAHRGALNRPPLVITAEVPRSELAYYTNERKEQEVVVLRKPHARVDDDPNSWRPQAAEFEANIHAQELQIVDSFPSDFQALPFSA